MRPGTSRGPRDGAGLRQISSARASSRFIARILSVVPALALASQAGANVVGSDAQNFNPITSGLDFVTVQSSETLEPGVFNLGLFANQAKNTFPYYDSASGSSQRTEKDNSLTGGDFNLGLGLGRNWDMGVSFPVILRQEISDTTNTGSYSSTGNTEIRVNTKYRLLGGSSQGLALVASANFNRIAGNPYVGQDGGPIFNLELAGDVTVGSLALAANAGYRWRNPGAAIAGTGIEPIPNQMIASVAASYLIDSIDTKFIAEVLAAFPEKSKLKDATDREYSVTEAILGVKYDVNSDFALHAGAGTSLAKGVSSPDSRFYVGLNWSFGPLFGKSRLQNDPYYENDRLVRYQRRRARKAALQRLAEIERASPSRTEPSAAPAPVPTPVAQVPRGKQPPPPVAAQPTPAPQPPQLQKPPAEIEETKPSVKTDSVSGVKVFDRGSYNHIVLNSIEFKSASDELTSDSERYLMQEFVPAIRELSRRRPIGSIVVEGHTDSVGPADENLVLSQRRARVVAELIRSHLALPIQLQASGLGESSPIADNGNFQGRALNRRVEFKLLYQKSSR